MTQILPLQQKQNAKNTLLKAFITKFTSDEFFVNLINLTLYPADFGTTHTSKTIDYIKTFLIDVEKIIKTNRISAQQILKNIQLTYSLLNIRESRSNILTYNNVFQHVDIQDLALTKLVQQAIENKIDDIEQFRQLKSDILNHIQAFYEVNSISGNMALYGNLVESVWSESVPVFEAVQNYKNIVINLYNDLSKLQTINKVEQEKDYFVLTDKKSVQSLANDLYKYVSTGYSFLQTGYNIFDSTVEGFESSSIHVISAPSNNGKSIFMVNLARSTIQNNIDEFEENDVILFLTLEDDIFKLFRRFASIFGDYKHTILKKLFKKSYELSKLNSQEETKNTSIEEKIKTMFLNVTYSSVLRTTQQKVGLVLKHCSENTFSPGDLGRFVDQLRVEGYNVKMIFADYIDVFSPTIQRYGSFEDYNAQGQIVHELRSLSRQYKLPVITATQNKRESENVNNSLNNSHIGDSFKKVRYTDYLYMCRMRGDLDVFDSPVKEHVFSEHELKNGIDPSVDAKRQYISDKLVPFEVKITKSKESRKDMTVFLLFCTDNLKIYNNISEYLMDISIIESNSQKLDNDIDLLTSMVVTNYLSSPDDEIIEAYNDIPF